MWGDMLLWSVQGPLLRILTVDYTLNSTKLHMPLFFLTHKSECLDRCFYHLYFKKSKCPKKDPCGTPAFRYAQSVQLITICSIFKRRPVYQTR